ncbi:MAG: hypothetical protein ACRD5B_14980, partial [Nitrososphaeraceae archaeon]
PEQWLRNKIEGQRRYFQTHSAHNKGVPHSEATKEKIRQSALKAGVGKLNKGRAVTWIYKIQESRKHSGENKKQLDDKGNRAL